jgi:hypothetical protein
VSALHALERTLSGAEIVRALLAGIVRDIRRISGPGAKFYVPEYNEERTREMAVRAVRLARLAGLVTL